MTRPVRLIGIDPASRTRVGGFAEYVRDQLGRTAPASFEPSEEARHRHAFQYPLLPLPAPFPDWQPDQPPPPAPPPSQVKVPRGVIVGNAIASYRNKNAHADTQEKDTYVLQPGDEVTLFTVSGQRLAPVYDKFVVCSYFKSEMSEYDAQYIFVPLDYLQKLRTMEDRVTSIQIKLKDYADAPQVVQALEALFPSANFVVQSWEHKQGPLLAAISIERGILNVLLFLIVGVAGFGILAIFSMIVVEKTRDIGILKALGASNAGVMKIFLGYGLLLGLLGAGLGTALGMAFTVYINQIEQTLGKWTGQDIFDRTVYYFNEIPTDMQRSTILLVNVGAVVIAVLFSVLPSLRAALLHPVQALRYE
jgi:lipoprotein-releasing system permease protein